MFFQTSLMISMFSVVIATVVLVLVVVMNMAMVNTVALVLIAITIFWATSSSVKKLLLELSELPEQARAK